MSLTVVKIESGLGRLILVAAGLICLAAGWFFVRWNFANVIASRIDTQRPESRLVAEWLTETAPSDPQTHLAAAVVFEKTFDAADLARSLREYEMMAALSPYNYLVWLNLSKARGMNGDLDGAAAAARRSLELAPNYASVQWAYGNLLVRQGRPEEGFSLVAKAASSNPDYANPAVATALEIFDGDARLVRSALGDGDVTNAALASALAGQGRFEDSYDAWSHLSTGERTGRFSKLGDALSDQLRVAKKFQLAARVAADVLSNEAERPVIETVANGGFENGVKLRNARPFEWQIEDAPQPQVGLSEGQAHSGKYNLWMMFNSFETAAFRSVSQTVAVSPGATYELVLFYRSDLKAAAQLRWEIADAATTAVIASTPVMTPAGDWTSLKTRFTVPADSDGVIIRLVREGCSGPSCPMNGKVGFDDISINRL